MAHLCLIAVAVSVLGGCSSPVPPTETGPLPAVTHEAIRFDTDAGPIVVMLYPEAAPQTIHLLKEYVTSNYYVGRAFYRTVPGHVIQVTDAAGGATDSNKTVPLETSPATHFSAGAAGIARSTDPHSGGPEFFIMDFATSHLDGNYTVWGQVVQGMDVVHRIARAPTVDAPALPPGVANPFPFDRMAVNPVKITGARLVAIEQAGATAAQFPLIVADDVRAGDYRHSLEAPADLKSGVTAQISWYIRAYNGQPLPPAATSSIRVDGGDLAVLEDQFAPGHYTALWTPQNAGLTHLSFLVQGVAWATLALDVQAPGQV